MKTKFQDLSIQNRVKILFLGQEIYIQNQPRMEYEAVYRRERSPDINLRAGPVGPLEG